MMSGLPIWWSTAIAVAVFGKVFMSLLCIDLYVNTQLLWLLLLEHSNSSNCVWNNITGIAVYWLIQYVKHSYYDYCYWSTAIAVAVFGKVLLVLLCIDLYVKHSYYDYCYWSTAIAVAVFGIILLVLPCIDLYVKHSYYDYCYWSTAIAVAMFGKVLMSLLCIDLFVKHSYYDHCYLCHCCVLTYMDGRLIDWYYWPPLRLCWDQTGS